MGDIKWGPDTTIRDVGKKFNIGAGDMLTFYKQSMAISLDMASHGADKSTCVASRQEVLVDYIYESLGRPKWFVDQEVLELLTSLHLEEDDLTGIFFPHDAFTLVFEQGSMLRGFPLRNMRVFNPASKLTETMLDTLGVKFAGPKELGMVSMLVDVGENGQTGQRAWDTPPERVTKLHWTRPLNKHNAVESHNGLDQAENEFMQAISTLLASALLYRAARPERVAEYVLPRSCRYNYRGDKSKYCRMLAPQPLYVQTASAADGYTGRTVAGHYRGWVLRILRNERYTRHADGTFKTVLVEPVAVKGGPVR